jgi:autotransporter-associated beta strand protein
MSGGETTVIVTNSGTTYTDTGLANGTTYYYVVTATGSGGVSGASPEASAMPSTAVSGIWTADASGNWGDAANWFGGNIADGDGSTADFGTINLTTNRTITLDAPHTLSTLKFGDTMPDHNWTLAGVGALTLGTTPVINVVNQAATMSTVIAGTAFTKTGLGTLTLNGAAVNTFTGTLVLNGGALTEDFSNLTTPVNLINSGVALSLGGGTLNLNSAGAGDTSQTFAGTALTAGWNTINVTNNGSSATLALKALTVTKGTTVQFSTNGIITTATAGQDALGILGARGNVANPVGYATYGTYDWATTDTTVGGTGSSPYTIIGLGSVAGGYVTSIGGTGQNENLDVQANQTYGPAGHNYGASTARFNSSGAASMNVNGGWLVLAGVLVTPNMGAVNVTISGGNWFPNYSSTVNASAVVWQNNLGGYLNYGDANSGLIDGKNSTANATSYIQAGPGTVVMGYPPVAYQYTGQSWLNGGCTVVFNDAGLGLPGTGAPVNLNGGTVVGNGRMTLDNGGGANLRPFNLLANGGGLAATAGNTMTIDGEIGGAAGTGSLTIGIPASSVNGNLVGVLPGSGSGTANAEVDATGAVALTGANTYTGNTLIASGTLLVNNAAGSGTGSGAVTVNAYGTLGGIGIISGAVTVNAGGVFAPGNPLGTLTINSNLTLATGSTTFMPVQHSPLTNGAVQVAGTLIAGGTLIVTNVGGALTNGDSFKLFSAGNNSGTFASLVLPPLPGKLAWNTNTLKVSGSLSVVTLMPPTIAAVQISGGNLLINGSGGVNNWPFILMATTNLAGAQWTPVTTNQFDAVGNFVLTNTISPNLPLMFYKLQIQ